MVWRKRAYRVGMREAQCRIQLAGGVTELEKMLLHTEFS